MFFWLSEQPFLCFRFLGCGILFLYSGTVFGTAASEISYRLLSVYGAVDSFPPLVHPFYMAWIAAMDSVPMANTMLLARFSSALFAAMAFILLAEILYLTPYNFYWEENIPEYIKKHARFIIAFVSVLFLAFSFPVWRVSTQAHYVPFHFFLLVASARVLVVYLRTAQLKYLFASAFIYSVISAEYSMLILLFPFTLVFVAYWILRYEQLSRGLLVKLAACCSAVIVVYAAQAAWLWWHPSSGWMEVSGFSSMFWYVVVANVRFAVDNLFFVGWLFLALLCMIPWLTVFLPGSFANPFSFPGSLFWQLIMTVLCVAVWLDPGRLVFPLYDPAHVRFMLLFCVVVTLGYLAGYWYCIGGIDLERKYGDVPRWRSSLRNAVLPVIALLLGVGVLMNALDIFLPSSSLDVNFMREIVKRADEKRFLLVSKLHESQLHVLARDHNRTMRVVNAGMLHQDWYRRYVGEKSDQPRLRSMADVSALAFLKTWFTSTQNLSDVALLEVPSELELFDVQVVPEAYFFSLKKTSENIDMDALLQQHRRLWETYSPSRIAAHRPNSNWMRRYCSTMANTFGVFLGDHGYIAEASEAYDMAWQYSTNNRVALLNHIDLARNHRLPKLEKLTSLYTNTAAGQAVILTSQGDSIFGPVRNASVTAARGIARAVDGRLDGAIEDLERSSGLQEDMRLDGMLAFLYLLNHEPQASEAVYQRILERQPENIEALTGMLQNSLMKGAVDRAASFFEKLKKVHPDPSVYRVQEIMILSMQGEMREASEQLLVYIEENPENLYAWSQLAQLAVRMKESDLAQRATKRLVSEQDLPESLYLLVARLLVLQGQFDMAETYVDKKLRLNQLNERALLMKLDFIIRRRDWYELKMYVGKLLSYNPNHYLANHYLGYIQIEEGRFEEAEISFRHSISVHPTPLAYNNLAWVLMKTGRADEALAYAQKALDAAPDLAGAWDTIANIYLLLRRYSKAENAASKARMIRPDHPGYIFTQARIYAAQGKKNEVQQIVAALATNQIFQALDEKNKLRQIRKDL